MTPAVAAGRFFRSVILGCFLGIFYGFLRPLRPRHTAPADLLFLGIVFPVWIYLGFGVCRGDLRPGYSFGLFLGCVLWEQTVGRLLRPVFRALWRILGLPAEIFRKILQKCRNIIKISFAYRKK